MGFVVDIIRDKDSYSFVMKETAELLCTINTIASCRVEEGQDMLRLLDEFWGRTESEGFRPVGTSLSDYRTMKTVEITPDQVERLRRLEGPKVQLLVGTSDGIGQTWWFRHAPTAIALSTVRPVDEKFLPVLKSRFMTAGPMKAPGWGLYTSLEFSLGELSQIGFCQEHIVAMMYPPVEEFR